MTARWDVGETEQMLLQLRPAFEPHPLIGDARTWREERTIPRAVELWQETLSDEERPAMLEVLRQWLNPATYDDPTALWHFVVRLAQVARITELADDLAVVAQDLAAHPPPVGPYVPVPALAAVEVARTVEGLRGIGPLPASSATLALADAIFDTMVTGRRAGPVSRTDDFGIRVSRYTSSHWVVPPARLQLTMAVWPASTLTVAEAEERTLRLRAEAAPRHLLHVSPVRTFRVVLPVFVLDEVSADLEWWALQRVKSKRRVTAAPIVVDACHYYLTWPGPDAIPTSPFTDDLGDLVDNILRRTIARAQPPIDLR